MMASTTENDLIENELTVCLFIISFSNMLCLFLFCFCRCKFCCISFSWRPSRRQTVRDRVSCFPQRSEGVLILIVSFTPVGKRASEYVHPLGNGYWNAQELQYVLLGKSRSASFFSHLLAAATRGHLSPFKH